MWKKIPIKGLTGEVLLREAVTEYRAVIDAVRAAVAKKMFPFAPDRWVSLEVVYPTYTIAEDDAGKMYQFDYTIDDTGNVTLGDPKQVVEQYVPVKEALGDNVFVEAVGEPNSGKWVIRVIKAGLSGNSNFYPDATLKESVPLFENVRVFIKSDAEHIKGDGKAVNNLIGRLTEVKFVAGNATDTGEIIATLEFIEPDGAVSTKVREAYARGMKDLFGFSIDANAKVKKTTRNGVAVREATKFTKVLSVDLIVEPGAGGQLIRMVEAIEETPNEPPLNQEQDMFKQRMLEAIKAKTPAAFALINPDTITDDQLEAAYREALIAGAPAGGENIANTVRVLEAQVRMSNATAAINASTLPKEAKDKLITDFAAREGFDDKAVADAITAEREYLGRFTESGKPVIHFGDGGRVEDKSVQMADMLDAFFDPAHKNHRAVGSFKECYIELTGDKRVTGRLENCDISRMRESMGGSFRESVDSSSFSNVLGNSITRRMIAEYNSAVDYQGWREIADVTPVNDFRTQERTRFGGYGDLPIVGEKDPYAAMTSPTDEKATYSVAKRGGTEDVTMEMVKNDDVGAIRRIPTKLARASARTLAKFVFDFPRINPVIYDGLALFHATHGNLGSAALDATSMAAARLAMLKQTELNSLDRLGVGPKTLLVPVDMQEAAVNLFNRSTNNDKTFIQANTLNIIPVWYWTDATDWALVADKRDIPTIEIGFLDGQEEPQLFVQDAPNAGSMFANDTITYKIRHIYGGNVLDYRGMYKAVVAG